MDRQRVLVTGGAGFIGSHTCKRLAATGIEPVTFDNLSTGNREAVRWGPLVEGDVADTALLADTICDYRIDAVVHFAASAYVGESVAEPALYYRNNVGGMISVLDGCRQAGVDKIIFSSSCATYGVPASLPISEDMEQRPINPYGRTKLIGEQMLADHAAAYGLRYVILRYFNACGADPDGDIGEWHDPETHLIPLTLMTAAGKRSELDIYGSDYPTPDGTCVRDYIHVCDLARAHVLAFEHLHSGGDNLSLNLGTGQGLSIRQIVDAVSAITGRDVAVSVKPRRPGDPPVLYTDPTLAGRELGFIAEMSDIGTIVKTAAPFFDLELADELQS